jgi:hypothetical protein
VLHFNEEEGRNTAADRDSEGSWGGISGGKEDFQHDQMTSKARWLEEVIAEKKLLPAVDIPCKVHYWYAHTLASLASSSAEAEAMLHDRELRDEVRAHLKQVLICFESESDRLGAESGSAMDVEKMSDYARTQLKEIDLVIEYVDDGARMDH